MRSLFILLFFLAITACANAQTDLSPDKKLKEIQQIKNDTQRMDALYSYAKNNLEDNPKECVKAGKILLQDAQNHEYNAEIANANNAIAEGYEFMADYPQSIKYYLEALRIRKELNLYNSQINTMLGISRVYDETGDLSNQKKYVEEAMSVCEKNKTDLKVRRKRSEVLDYLATIYKKEGKYDTSFKLYNEAIALARRDSDKAEEMNSLGNLAIALKSNKNYEASLATYKQAIALLDTAKEEYTFAVLNDDMAILFYQMGDLPKSEQYSLKALAVAKKTNNLHLLIDIYDNLKNTYQKEKKYPEALDYFSKWSAIKDTIFDHDKLELQTKYNADAKDKQIAIQDTQIVFNRKVNLFLVLISLLLVAIVILVVLNQRKKKFLDEQKSLRMQQQLEVKDRDNEIYRLRNVELKNSNDEIVLRNHIIKEEKRKSEQLLLNILPEETAGELMQNGHASSRKYELVSVMFIDIVGFTVIAEQLKAEELVERIDHYFQAFDNIVLEHGLEKIKTIGDSYMCAGGLPVINTSNPVDIVNAALDIMQFVVSDESRHFFAVRIGIHSGPLVAGVVGKHKFQYDIWGDTVNVAARIEENSAPGRINISGGTYDLVKDHFDCEYRGKIKAKNKGELDMYFVNRRPV